MASTRQEMFEYLQQLVGQPFIYGYKTSDCDLYDLGFGKKIIARNYKGEFREVCTHIIHAVCPFNVIWRNSDCRTETYDENTTYKVFHSCAKRMIGLTVKQIKLSDKNDLWLDFGDCTVVFLSLENEKESWRFFMWGEKNPHLVVSNTWLEFNY